MRHLFKGFLILSMVYLTYSCEKIEDIDNQNNLLNELNDSTSILDTSENKDSISPTDTLKDIPQVILTPSESKDKLSETAANFISEMSSLTESPAVEAAINMITLVNGFDDEEDNYYNDAFKSAAVSPMVILAKYGNNEASAMDLLVYLRTLKAEPDTEIEKEYLDEIAGTLIWDAAADSFKHTDGTKLIVKFPSSKSATSNDAIFTVEKFAFENSNTLGEEVPTALKANLTVGGTKVMEVSFNANYVGGIPTAVTASATISDFVFSAAVSDENSRKASAEYSLKRGSTELMSFSANIEGNYSESNITSNTKYYKEECTDDENYNWICEDVVITKTKYEELEDDESSYINTWEEVDMSAILSKANASFSIMKLQMVGTFDDIKGMITEMDAVDWDDIDTEAEEKAAVDKEVVIMNKYLSFYLTYDGNQKIADVDFYTSESEYENYDCIWNETTYTEDCDYVTYMDYYSEPEFIFTDDTRLDPEVYFDAGFDAVITEINNIVKKINIEYADYIEEPLEEIISFDEI